VPAGPKWWNAELLHDPAIAALASKVRCTVESSWGPVLAEQVETDGIWCRIPVSVSVRSTRGSWELAADYAKGDPWDPRFPLTDDELAAKVVEYTADALGQVSADLLVDAGRRLDQDGAINDLVRALSSSD
jgi:2-methylcitrate dehydratase PrpD